MRVVLDHVKDAQDAPDAEDLVLVRKVHRKEDSGLRHMAIVALAVLVQNFPLFILWRMFWIKWRGGNCDGCRVGCDGL